jgi:uroporphyrinogen-III synthase
VEFEFLTRNNQGAEGKIMESMENDRTKPAESFGGLRVVAFESRMAEETSALIVRFGGIAVLAPAMREIPVEDNGPVFEFADAIKAGRFDIVVFLTGVGVRELFRVIETRHPRSAIVAALRRTVMVARGPKPAKAMRDLGLTPNAIAQEPQTWREVLTALSATTSINGKSVAVQEYGAPAPDLRGELERMGARVTPVPVYRWALPIDCGPLENAARKIAARELDVALFTSATQVANLMTIARNAGIDDSVSTGLRTMAVCSIGPVCSAALKARSIEVDIEPQHPRLGHLVKEAAGRSPEIVRCKRGGKPV